MPTTLVAITGAAGIASSWMRRVGLDFPTTAALWWTAMLLTTMGSDYWREHPRAVSSICCWPIYAFAAFGYMGGGHCHIFRRSE